MIFLGFIGNEKNQMEVMGYMMMCTPFYIKIIVFKDLY
jgi:hypothetical protein